MTKTRDAAETKERILQHALPLFAQGGYAGTSVRKLANAADVNVATLAYHFGGKEGLYTQVCSRLHADLATSFPVEPPAGTPQEILAWWIVQGWTFCVEHRVHIRLLMRNVLDEGRLPAIAVERSGPLLDRGEAIIYAFQPTWSSQQRRLLIMTIQHAVVRFVMEEPAQLAKMVGVPVEDVDDAVIDWLGQLIQRQLGLAN